MLPLGHCTNFVSYLSSIVTVTCCHHKIKSCARVRVYGSTKVVKIVEIKRISGVIWYA